MVFFSCDGWLLTTAAVSPLHLGISFERCWKFLVLLGWCSPAKTIAKTTKLQGCKNCFEHRVWAQKLHIHAMQHYATETWFEHGRVLFFTIGDTDLFIVVTANGAAQHFQGTREILWESRLSVGNPPRLFKGLVANLRIGEGSRGWKVNRMFSF